MDCHSDEAMVLLNLHIDNRDEGGFVAMETLNPEDKVHRGPWGPGPQKRGAVSERVLGEEWIKVTGARGPAGRGGGFKGEMGKTFSA